MDYSKSWKQTRMIASAWGTYVKHYQSHVHSGLHFPDLSFHFLQGVSSEYYMDFITKKEQSAYMPCIVLFFLYHQNLCS